MAWILNLVVCLTFLDMSLSYNHPQFQQWGWQWPYNEYHYSQIASTAYRYPIPSQSLRLSPFPVVEHEQYKTTGYDRSNLRDSHRINDNRMYERSISSGNQQNMHGVSARARVAEPAGTSAQKRNDSFDSTNDRMDRIKPMRRRGQMASNKITFPGPAARPSVSFRSDVPEVPEACKTQSFCEEVPGYPQEEINELITKLENDKFSFPLDKLEVPDTPDINQRVGPLESNLELCNSREKLIHPKMAKDANDQWKTLVNRDDNPVQGFRVEICDMDESPCADFVFFQRGYTARCKQKYVLRTAVVAEKVGDTYQNMEMSVQLPSCCSCVAKKETGRTEE